MTLFQFLLKIKANLRLDWDYHKQKWRASVPGAGYIMAAVTSQTPGNAATVTVNYFGTKYLPYRAYGDSASWAVQTLVHRIRGAKMMRANKIHIVPVDLSVSAFTDFPSVSGPDVTGAVDEDSPTEVIYPSPALGAMAVETVPPGGLTYEEVIAKTLPWPSGGVVTPDYPDVEESVPFPFKKQFKKKEPEPKLEPPKKDKIDPFF
jgi:hypothetical protein